MLFKKVYLASAISIAVAGSAIEAPPALASPASSSNFNLPVIEKSGPQAEEVSRRGRGYRRGGRKGRRHARGYRRGRGYDWWGPSIGFGIYLAPQLLVPPPPVYYTPVPQYGGVCEYWAAQCQRNWSRRVDVLGCLRYQGCL